MTLSGRINKWFLLHAVLIMMLNSALTLVSLFVIEDAFFNRELQQASRSLKAESDLSNYQRLSRNLTYYPHHFDSPFQHLPLNTEGIEEITLADKYFHVLVIQDDTQAGFLVSDVTDRMVVSHSLDDLMVLFVPLLIVVLCISLLMARFLSGLALRPFNRMVALVQAGSQQHRDREEIAQIKESDIRSLVLEIVNAWKEQEALLDKQIQFNLGISHEIRTPLQVAKNALELISVNDETSKRALSRLLRSHEKMENIGTAFLWLSSDNIWQEETIVNPIVREAIQHLEVLSQRLNKSIILISEQDCYLKMPGEVIYVIVENIFNNALQHSAGEEITVRIESSRLVVSNDVSQAADNKGFGIGLTIIELLVARFGLQFDIDVKDTNYTVILGK